MIHSYPNSPPVDEKTIAELTKYSPLNNYEKFKNTALLVQNGAKDKMVPPAGSRSLDKLLTKAGNTPRAYRYIEYPDAIHEVPDKMLHQSVTWFKKYL